MAEVQLGSPEGLAKLKEEIAAVQKRLDELDEEIPPLESAAMGVWRIVAAYFAAMRCSSAMVLYFGL